MRFTNVGSTGYAGNEIQGVVLTVSIESRTVILQESYGDILEVSFELSNSPIFTVPSVGEEWICTRIGGVWYLDKRTSKQNTALNRDLKEGDQVWSNRSGRILVEGADGSVMAISSSTSKSRPKTPLGLRLVTQHQENGTSTLKVFWAEVNETVDGKKLSDVQYEVWVSEGAGYYLYGKTSENFLKITDFPEVDALFFKVRVVTDTLFGDFTPPESVSSSDLRPSVTQKPSTPVLTSVLDRLSIKWDGLFEDRSQATSLSKVKAFGITSRDPDEIIELGSLYGAGELSYAFSFLPVTVTVYFIGYDNWGRPTEQSAQAVRTLTGALNTEALTQVRGEVESKVNEARRELESSTREREDALKKAVDSKSTIIRSGSTPNKPGTTPGDLWWQYPNSSLEGTVIGQWVWDGERWKESLIGSSIIADGAVTVEKITASESLMTKLLSARKIYANDLVVGGGDNLIRDPFFQFTKGSSRLWLNISMHGVDAVDESNASTKTWPGTPSFFMVTRRAGDTNPTLWDWYYDCTPVTGSLLAPNRPFKPSQSRKYVLRFEVAIPQSSASVFVEKINSIFTPKLFYITARGTRLYAEVDFLSTKLTPSTLVIDNDKVVHTYEAMFELPDTAVGFTLRLQAVSYNNPAVRSVTSLYVSNVTLKEKKSSADLIVDGDLWATLAKFDKLEVLDKLTAQNAEIPGTLIGNDIFGKSIYGGQIAGAKITQENYSTTTQVLFDNFRNDSVAVWWIGTKGPWTGTLKSIYPDDKHDGVTTESRLLSSSGGPVRFKGSFDLSIAQAGKSRKLVFSFYHKSGPRAVINYTLKPSNNSQKTLTGSFVSSLGANRVEINLSDSDVNSYTLSLTTKSIDPVEFIPYKLIRETNTLTGLIELDSKNNTPTQSFKTFNPNEETRMTPTGLEYYKGGTKKGSYAWENFVAPPTGYLFVPDRWISMSSSPEPSEAYWKVLRLREAEQVFFQGRIERDGDGIRITEPGWYEIYAMIRCVPTKWGDIWGCGVSPWGKPFDRTWPYQYGTSPGVKSGLVTIEARQIRKFTERTVIHLKAIHIGSEDTGVNSACLYARYLGPIS
nr:MAG TPA: hypothetical protein [Caudoviricetes sp.]